MKFLLNMDNHITLDDALDKISSSRGINPRWRSVCPEAGNLLLSTVPDAETITEAVYRVKNGLIDRPKCIQCDARVTFSQKNKAYSRFCGPRCGSLNDCTKAKHERTNIAKYGTANPTKFGSSKFKSAMVAKYGVEVPFKSDELKNKAANTNLSRYGVRNVFAAEDVVQKIKNTNLLRRGVACSMQDETVKAKFRDTDGTWKANKGIQKRSAAKHLTEALRIRTRLEFFGFELVEVSGVFHEHKNKHLLRHTCGHEFSTSLANGIIPICRKCDPKLVGTSKLQQTVQTILTDLGVEFEVGKRILSRKELDIFVPSSKFGIEVNGLYWHSTQAGKSTDYHLRKTEDAQKLGITLVHLFEDDIVQSPNIVKSMLAVRLGLATKIAARTCKIDINISKEEAKAFIEQNHLSGTARFDFAIGLRCNDRLVSVASFAKPRYSGLANLEMIRFCTEHNTVVIGGLSKIIAALPRPTTLLSYADRCYSTGAAYYKTGFKLVKTIPPSCWNFKGPENIRTHHTQLRKYKLLRADSRLDPSKTERQLIQEAGWNQIWDCGHLAFILDLPNYTHR